MASVALVPLSPAPNLGYSVLFPHEKDWETMFSLWDGQWYRFIVEDGYELNYSLSSGEPANWAFFPLYPVLVKLLTLVGLPVVAAGSAISIVCTPLALVMLFRICYDYSKSLWAGIFVILPIVMNPAFFVTEALYTEGLALLVVSLLLYNLVKKRFLLVAILLLVAGVTRGIGAPLCLLIMIYLAVEFYKHRRLSKTMILMGLASVVGAAIWPVTVAIFLGSPTASLELLALWVDTDRYSIASIVGLPILLLLLSANKKVPWEWRAWSAIYITYITATTYYTLGIVRYFMLALVSLPFVVDWIPQRLRPAIYSAAVVLLIAAGAYGQYWWLTSVWVVTSPVHIDGIGIP
jgi:hypothetical protein